LVSSSVGCGSFIGVKWPRCENHLPPSSAKVKDEWHYTSSPTISLHDVNRKNFAFCTWCVAFYFVNFWCRWEEEKKEDGTKWNFLEHKGPVFAPSYERLPPDIKFFYDGLCFLHYCSTTYRLPWYYIIKHNWHADCMLMYIIKFWEELPQCLLSLRCCYVVKLMGNI
jgi:Eukaryotic DNA topoisomerase I, DNA binding fragment.